MIRWSLSVKQVLANLRKYISLSRFVFFVLFISVTRNNNQIPQYFLESLRRRKVGGLVGITQPRRVAGKKIYLYFLFY